MALILIFGSALIDMFVLFDPFNSQNGLVALQKFCSIKLQH